MIRELCSCAQLCNKNEQGGVPAVSQVLQRWPREQAQAGLGKDQTQVSWPRSL